MLLRISPSKNTFASDLLLLCRPTHSLRFRHLVACAHIALALALIRPITLLFLLAAVISLLADVMAIGAVSLLEPLREDRRRVLGGTA